MASIQTGYVGGAKTGVTQGVSNPGAVPIQVVALGDGEGNLLEPAGADGVQLVSTGGGSTVAVATGKATLTVIKAAPGRLCRVLVTGGVGAGTPTFFDNATAASGTVIGVVVASAAVGTVADFQMPAAAGITLGGSATNPAMTISFV